jgi:tight adherence protein B
MDLTLILYLGGGFAIVLLIVGIVVSISSEKSFVEERIDRYAEKPTVQTREKKNAATPLTDWLNRRVERSSIGDQLSKNLARADLKLKPGEYVSLMVICAFIVGLIVWFVGRENIALGMVGAIGGFFIPNFYVKQQQGKRLIKFNEQLPDMLNLMVNGLRAGYSTMQAMESISKELPPPLSDEFRRVVQEMQLGITMEHALDNLIRRIPSDDLDLCVTAINVQREVGGNLAEILDTISFTIRERVRIKGEIRTLTAQQMYSGRFLSLLPVIVVAILYLLNPAYMSEFFSQDSNGGFPCGYVALGIAGLLIILGYVVMNKLGQIEV